ncbi:hypothetical protein NQ314_003127 [Rhamnusium bicolor]|uniref:DNA repair protein Rev1 C-terminal domain-containing protein n=1 Tax=Rhamnusium bicolor TaxID=1586634 RepID=A0AAV8ZPK7_9CUCU|nr:hypothetical protein NQ314_003127 [Rhamnusium bicolor]
MPQNQKGRPKGIRSVNGNRASKNIGKSSLNKYFGKNKNTSQCQTSKQQQNSQINEEIDLNVLNELPEELRNEIIKQYKLEHKIKESTNSSPPKLEETKAECPRIQENTQGPVKNDSINDKANPFSKLPWDKIKPIIKQWVHSADKPSQMDTEMLASHFRQLAIDREIETLKSVFNFLHRIFSELNCHWHKAYFSIVNITQEGMVARYGGTLMVKRKFDCCHM